MTSTGPGQSRPVTHRYRQGGLQIPAELAGVVVAVLGLDNRPQARPHVRRAELAAQQVQYTPPQVAAIYQFPEGTDGTGQTIAIIELGGGFVDTDLDTYFPSLGLAVPSVTVVGVDGASNGGEGQDPPQEYVEVALDIEVAGSVAPGAALVVYFAPNSDQGWLDGVSEAIQATPTPTAVSISWGGPRIARLLRPTPRWTPSSPMPWRSASPCAWHRVTTAAAMAPPTAIRLRFPGVQPARAGVRRDKPAGRSGHRDYQLGDGLE